jgi:hypothetical protein
MSWKEEYWKSIKSFDTEEKLDLYFYRPFGFVIAKAAMQTPLTPTGLTIIGLAMGISSGYFFYHNESTQSLVIASVLLVMAGVFDSSDGQLARMGGKSTKLGLVLDGLCDNLVFASAYIGSTLTIAYILGPWTWPIALLAGACHSFQSSMLDYYNREYLYFGVGKVNGDYWNPTLTEARGEKSNAQGDDKIFWALRFSWLWQQTQLSSRSDPLRLRWRELVNGPRSEEFQAVYRDHNRLILRFWRLMGPNFHTILILVCVFLRRFDLYLLLGDILFLTIALLILRVAQKKADAKLIAALEKRGLV